MLPQAWSKMWSPQEHIFYGPDGSFLDMNGDATANIKEAFATRSPNWAADVRNTHASRGATIMPVLIGATLTPVIG